MVTSFRATSLVNNKTQRDASPSLDLTKTEKQLVIKANRDCDERLSEFDHDMRVQICTYGDFQDRLTEIETVI
jgi:hypothetical protein